MKKAVFGQPRLDFDPPSPPADTGTGGGVPAELLDTGGELPPPDWHEVPAARFLSWSPAMQLMYCADRDENSGQGAESPELAAWYYARAASYMQELVALSSK